MESRGLELYQYVNIATVPPRPGGFEVRFVHRSSSRSARRVRGRIIRALWLTVALCLIVAIAVHHLMARDALRRQWVQEGTEHGLRIVLALESAGASLQRRAAILHAYFDSQNLHRLELLDAAGDVVFQRIAATRYSAPVGAAMHALLPSTALVDTALPQRGGALPGAVLRVEPSRGAGIDRLWRDAAMFAGVTGLALAVVLFLGLLAVRGLGRQVDKLASGQSGLRSDLGVTTVPATTTSPAPQPSDRRLRKLARLEGIVVAQARELDDLRRLAGIDPLTGLPGRESSMGRLAQLLDGDAESSAAALLLLRVRDLVELNRRLGHEAANQILCLVGEAVQAEVVRTDAALAGRLNGSDFILMLPLPDAARSTAESLISRLRSAVVAIDPHAGLAIGAVDLSGRIDLGQAMALADEALANAEAQGSFAVAVARHLPRALAFGDSAWQQRLSTALSQGRMTLGSDPVCGPDGRLLYLDCPLRVQFDEFGEFESAARWRAPAARGRLGPEIDLRAVRMALEAIGSDGVERCINVAPQSLASSEFMLRLTLELESAPVAAGRLWIDIPESVALDRRELVHEAARRWRPLGVRLALEHAGEHLQRIENLPALGLNCVRVDGRFVRGLTGVASADMRSHLLSLVKRVHEAGLTITAEGVALAGDLALVWTMGFDAATGPAVQKRGHSISPQ